MKDRRYYSVSYDERNYPEIVRLRLMCGGIVAYGRWEAIKQLLFDAEGSIDIRNPMNRELLKHELDFTDDEELKAFLDACVDVGLLVIEYPSSSEALISSDEVSKGLKYRKDQAARGKKGGNAKAAKKQS